VLLGGAKVDKVRDIDNSVKILAKRKKRERTAGEMVRGYAKNTTAEVGYNRKILRHLIPVCP